jgi:hypothetical protein
MIMTIRGSNVALRPDGTLAAFQSSKVMVHRDTKRLMALAVAAVRRARKPRRRPSRTRPVNNSLTGYRVGAAQEVGLSPSFASFRQPTLNLGMLVSAKCNVRINLRSMVRRVSVITLAG